MRSTSPAGGGSRKWRLAHPAHAHSLPGPALPYASCCRRPLSHARCAALRLSRLPTCCRARRIINRKSRMRERSPSYRGRPTRSAVRRSVCRSARSTGSRDWFKRTQENPRDPKRSHEIPRDPKRAAPARSTGSRRRPRQTCGSRGGRPLSDTLRRVCAGRFGPLFVGSEG